jgi:hypothetical protein
MVVWEKLPDEVENDGVWQTWEGFDRATAMLFTISHGEFGGAAAYELEAMAGPDNITTVGEYSSLKSAQDAATEYLKKLDGDEFLAHGVGSGRENDLVAGAHGGDDREV